MLIIVASKNIFRRELTSFVLSEAGYAVSEARDLPALLASLANSPKAVILDAQLEGDPAAALVALRRRSGIPVLWLAEADRTEGLLEAGHCAQIEWPFRTEALLERLAALLTHGDADDPEAPFQERCIGSAA